MNVVKRTTRSTTGSISQYFRRIFIRPSAGWIVIYPAAGVYLFAGLVNYTEGHKIGIFEEKLAYICFGRFNVC